MRGVWGGLEGGWAGRGGAGGRHLPPCSRRGSPPPRFASHTSFASLPPKQPFPTPPPPSINTSQNKPPPRVPTAHPPPTRLLFPRRFPRYPTCGPAVGPTARHAMREFWVRRGGRVCGWGAAAAAADRHRPSAGSWWWQRAPAAAVAAAVPPVAGVAVPVGGGAGWGARMGAAAGAASRTATGARWRWQPPPSRAL